MPTQHKAGHYFTFEYALKQAQANAKRNGKPWFVVGYTHTWRAEPNPAGNFCYKVQPDGSWNYKERV